MILPTHPRVSFIVATRNRAQFVRSALPMWKRLKGPNDELIVVDGNSTDGTYEILKEAEPGLIDVLVHEPDRSEAHAFNKGLLHARGELVKLLTDDDFYFPAALEYAYQTMFDHPEVDVLLTGGEHVSKWQDSSNEVVQSYQWVPDGQDLSKDLGYITMTGVGIIIRRDSLAVTGLIDPRHKHADTSFLTQAIVRGATVRYLRVKGFRHITYEHSLSLDRRRKKYIYKDHNLHGWSRWRYITRPGLACEMVLKRLGILKKKRPSCEPAWDGRLM